MSDKKGGLKSGFSKILLSLLQRSFWLYCAVAMILFFLLDTSAARLNRLNALKQIEIEIKGFEEGRIPLDTKDFEWAVRYYHELLHFLPESAPLYGNLGFCYYYLKQENKALEVFQKAIAIEPQWNIPYWDMGMMSFQSGDLQNAIFFLNKFFVFLPMTRQYYEKFAEALQSKGKTDKLYLVMRLKQRSQSDEEEAYVKLAHSYYFLKDYRNMRDMALRGLNVYPRAQRLHYSAGLAQYLLANYSEAVKNFSYAIELDPNDINAYYYRGLCMEKLGHIIHHKRDLQQIFILKGKGIKPKEIVRDDFKLHLNTELMVLRYQM